VNNQIGNHLSDKNLVERVLSGDTRAFGIIIKNTEGLVTQIIYKMIPNEEDRKDISQDIYLNAFHKLSGFKFQSKISTWIGQIAYNRCLSYIEKKKLIFPGYQNEDGEYTGDEIESLSAAVVFDSSYQTEVIIFQKQISSILKAEIEKLSPIYKTLITLYHNEELSYDEIAGITNLPSGTVKSYLFRARKMLKDHLLSKYKKESL